MTTGSRQIPLADGVVVEGETDRVAVGESVGCPPVAVVAPEQLASVTASAQIPRNFTLREPVRHLLVTELYLVIRKLYGPGWWNVRWSSVKRP
jgi:hypothetical protein